METMEYLNISPQIDKIQFEIGSDLFTQQTDIDFMNSEIEAYNQIPEWTEEKAKFKEYLYLCFHKFIWDSLWVNLWIPLKENLSDEERIRRRELFGFVQDIIKQRVENLLQNK